MVAEFKYDKEIVLVLGILFAEINSKKILQPAVKAESGISCY